MQRGGQNGLDYSPSRIFLNTWGRVISNMGFIDITTCIHCYHWVTPIAKFIKCPPFSDEDLHCSNQTMFVL